MYKKGIKSRDKSDGRGNHQFRKSVVNPMSNSIEHGRSGSKYNKRGSALFAKHQADEGNNDHQAADRKQQALNELKIS